MQTSRRCLYAFLTCNRVSCFTRDVTRHHHWRVSSWVMWLRMLLATTSLPKQPFAFFTFLQRFSPEWPIRTCSKITAVILLCTDDDNSSYQNVCNMSFVSFVYSHSLKRKIAGIEPRKVSQELSIKFSFKQHRTGTLLTHLKTKRTIFHYWK